ncbi:MAG: nucleotidyltransferase domain-containing protein [Desulfobacterales bacterium]
MLKIGIFGSLARGKDSKRNLIDIVVVLEKQDLLNIIGIKQDLESKLYVPVDIVSYRTNEPFLKAERIDNEAV